MIGYLQGIIIDKRLPDVWLVVNGVGYRVKVGSRLGSNLGIGEETAMYIHTAVREDALDLYGLADKAELILFELLISVSGVGPKIALAIMGTQTVERVEQAVREADVSFFQKIPGIGKKGAQRIIVDLKGKLPQMKELDLTADGETDDEVVGALMQFGFKRPEVLTVLESLETGLTTEQKVREGLKRLGRK